VAVTTILVEHPAHYFLSFSSVTTGEEDEYTVHTVKAKLLVMDGKSDNWKERGTGTLRINTKKTHGNSSTRLVMRADSVFRVILNVPLFVGMKVWIMQEKFVRFAAFETVESVESGDKKDDAATSGSTKLVNYALKVKIIHWLVCLNGMDIISDNAVSNTGGQRKLCTRSL
jgi:RanBP1 domain